MSAERPAALDRELAILRAAERLGLAALRWLPYPSDDLPGHAMTERDADDALIQHDLDLIRRRLTSVEHASLVAAQERGEASV